MSVINCQAKIWEINTPTTVTAVEGSCVVIPCQTQPHSRVIWYQYHKINYPVVYDGLRPQTMEYQGRVSLLEPDVRQRICSIVINDLKESDSGAYQFRVIGTRDSDRYQFLQKVLISVKEGREATLTCTAPGLCSGSAPEFLWTWSGAGGSISGNITTLTDRLNAIANRYSSTLTFNPSAEHHGTNITCTVRLTDDRTTEETVTLNVSCEITGETTVKEHETLNLTCSVDSFPPSRITWIKLSDLFLQNGTETVVQNDTSAELLNETETSEQEDGDKNSLIISDVTTLTKEINVTVKCDFSLWADVISKFCSTDRRNPQMAGSTAVNDGDVLNLTCSADSFPPSLIIWTKLGFNTTLQTDSGSASLVIPNVTAEDSGQYVCTAVYLDSAATEYADVTVTCKSTQLKMSECDICVHHHTEYSIMTTVSNHTVNSTVTLSLKTEGNTTVECVSGNENGELKKTLPVEKKLSGKEGKCSEPQHFFFKAQYESQCSAVSLHCVIRKQVIACGATLTDRIQSPDCRSVHSGSCFIGSHRCLLDWCSPLSNHFLLIHKMLQVNLNIQ
uniref:B-cell receptor CD22 n=1 Tax=Salarias fasciatus TaxID=181472 RepID=A0A672G2K2_SALFA